MAAAGAQVPLHFGLVSRIQMLAAKGSARTSALDYIAHKNAAGIEQAAVVHDQLIEDLVNGCDLFEAPIGADFPPGSAAEQQRIMKSSCLGIS